MPNCHGQPVRPTNSLSRTCSITNGQTGVPCISLAPSTPSQHPHCGLIRLKANFSAQVGFKVFLLGLVSIVIRPTVSWHKGSDLPARSGSTLIRSVPLTAVIYSFWSTSLKGESNIIRRRTSFRLALQDQSHQSVGLKSMGKPKSKTNKADMHTLGAEPSMYRKGT